MKYWYLVLGLVLLAGCTFPGFDYNTEPQQPSETETSLSVWTAPQTIGVGEELVVYGNYQADGNTIDGASCRTVFGDIKSGMSRSIVGYMGTIDAGGLEKGTYSVGVECSKPGYQSQEGSTSFKIE